MSGSEERDASRLVRELADTAGAVPVLVTLLERGGSASRKALLAAGDGRDVDGAIRWLTAVDLVCRPGTSWTIDLDQHGTSYELTAVGATLTRSLMELVNALSDPTATPLGEARIAEG